MREPDLMQMNGPMIGKINCKRADQRSRCKGKDTSERAHGKGVVKSNGRTGRRRRRRGQTDKGR